MKKIIALFLVLSFISLPYCYAEQEILVRITKTAISENMAPSDTISGVLVSDFNQFKKGMPVILFPSEIKKCGFCGRGGYFEIRKGIISDLEGKEYLLTLKQKVKGSDKDWVIVAISLLGATILFSPLAIPFVFIKGHSAKLEEGTVIECTF